MLGFVALGGILALTALTLEDLPADHPDRHNLEVVLHQTERCRDIVRGLLDFSRQSDVSMQELDVNAVLQETLALVTQQSAFFNVEIERHSDHCDGRTVVDLRGVTGREPNAEVGVDVDAPRFLELLCSRIESLP